MRSGQLFELVALGEGHYRLSVVRAKRPSTSVVKIFVLDAAVPVAKLSVKEKEGDIVVDFSLDKDTLVRLTHLVSEEGEEPVTGSISMVRREPSTSDLLFCCAHPTDEDYDDLRFHLSRYADENRTVARPVFDDPRDLEARVASMEARLLTLKGKLP